MLTFFKTVFVRFCWTFASLLGGCWCLLGSSVGGISLKLCTFSACWVHVCFFSGVGSDFSSQEPQASCNVGLRRLGQYSEPLLEGIGAMLHFCPQWSQGRFGLLFVRESAGVFIAHRLFAVGCLGDSADPFLPGLRVPRASVRFHHCLISVFCTCTPHCNVDFRSVSVGAVS